MWPAGQCSGAKPMTAATCWADSGFTSLAGILAPRLIDFHERKPAKQRKDENEP